MPKLLQIDTCLGILSTGKIAEDIAKVATSQGWECHIMHGARYVGNTVQQHYQVSSRLEEYIHYAKSYLLDGHGLGSSHATKRIIKKIQEIKPDIVQLHCIHGYYINYKLLFDYLITTDIPIVWTFHDCWAFTGHCAYFDSINCNKWRTGCFDCQLKGTYPKSLFFDRSSRNWRLKKALVHSIKKLTIVSVSKWLDSLVSQSFLSDKKHLVIYNGVDTTTFQPRISDLRQKYGLENKKLLLAAATSWSDSKGLYDYIDLSKRLKHDEQLVLLGLTNEQIKGLPSNILKLPRTENTIELAKWYSTADIVLNLSYQETFGLTTVEGMSCGTPGIVYDCTASPELISENTGIVVSPHNIDGILNAISRIGELSKQSYSKACRNHVLENFDMKKQFEKYINLYNKLYN